MFFPLPLCIWNMFVLFWDLRFSSQYFAVRYDYLPKNLGHTMIFFLTFLVLHSNPPEYLCTAFQVVF